MNTLQRYWIAGSYTLASWAMNAPRALAEFAGNTPDIEGTPEGADEASIRETILKVLTLVLNFLALIAVIFIIIAGIRLIVSQGEDEAKDKSKKTILYVIIGLIIILFARVIVGLVTNTLSEAATN